MSVAICREINRRLRAAGIVVHEWPGCWSRGNGLTSKYRGGIVHHTASNYGMAYTTLFDGRPGLSGPLCNYAGNADGSITMMAAHPANHAGASGGKSMGPLPVTSLFNPYVLGLEIVYPGTSPMRSAQYRAACVWGRIVADVVGGGNIQTIRAHGETSITGKWDPGFAPPSRMIDMGAFRRDAASALYLPAPTPPPTPPTWREDDSMHGTLPPAVTERVTFPAPRASAVSITAGWKTEAPIVVQVWVMRGNANGVEHYYSHTRHELTNNAVVTIPCPEGTNAIGIEWSSHVPVGYHVERRPA